MPAHERKLQNLLIERRLQLRLLSYFIGLFLITTATLYSTIFIFFWKLKRKGLDVGIPDGHVFYKFLAGQKHDMDLLFLGLAAFNLVLLISVGFLISHRLAGPYHKLKLHLASLAPDSPDLKLREKDFFQDSSPIVNGLRDRLKK